jgi:hypothetical protein
MPTSIHSISLGGIAIPGEALEILNRDGIFTFRTTTGDWRDELLLFASKLGSVVIEDDCDEFGIKTIRSQGGFKGTKLHTDRASQERPPEIVLIYCELRPSTGGESTYVDGKRLLEILSPEVITAFSAEHSVCFGFPAYLRMTQVIKATGDGRHFIKFRMDRFGFYSTGLLPYLDTFVSAAKSLQEECSLESGMGIVYRNDRFLHGARPAPHGEGLMHRVLISDSSLRYGF